MTGFDFEAPAELFASASKKAGRRPMQYRRFPTAAMAIRYALEELPPEMLVGAVLEVGEERYDGDELRVLYGRADYPLTRSPGTPGDRAGGNES